MVENSRMFDGEIVTKENGTWYTDADCLRY